MASCHFLPSLPWVVAPRYPVALVRRSGGPRLRLRKHKPRGFFFRLHNPILVRAPFSWQTSLWRQSRFRSAELKPVMLSFGLDLSAARLADEERPVRALVVLPPRHMTAALRHRQSRSARLRGQLRPSDDRLVFSDRWARSLSGPSPACRSPVRLAARGPLACSPPPPRVPAPPRFPAPDRARAGRRRRALADRAAAAQAVAAPPRPSPSARACHCRRRRRSTRSPCVVRVMLCVWQMAPAGDRCVPPACPCVYVWTCHLSLYDS